MRRAGNLLEPLVDRENLRRAVAKALLGKRNRPDAGEFTTRLDENLTALAEGIRDGSYKVGRFHQFVIHDPKERIITAPCFSERVLHHAIMNVCEPVLERWLIPDTYACRVGRGRLAALDRARHFSRRNAWFLKLDIRKYFDSIPHDALLRRLGRRFKDRRLLDWFERIVRAFRGPLGRGLPIGSLTSQHFANFYLGWFDRFVKESLRIHGYVRYMDDMLIWGHDRATLQQMLVACREFLSDELALAVKPHPYMNRTEHGCDFLGCRVFSSHLTLNRRSRLRFRRKLSDLESQFDAGLISEAELQQRATSVTAFTRTPGVSAWRFRRTVIETASAAGREAPTA